MKRMLMFLMVVLWVNMLQAQKNTCTVSGQIAGLKDTFLLAYHEGNVQTNARHHDTIPVYDGKFSYSFETDHIKLVRLLVGSVKKSMKGKGYISTKAVEFVFFAEPGTHIQFTGQVTDFVDAYPTGTRANDDLAVINRTIHPLMNQAVNLILARAKDHIAEKAINEMSDSIQSIEAHVDDLKKQFIMAHPASVAAAWYLQDMMIRTQISNEDAMAAYSSMDENALGSVSYYQDVAIRMQGLTSTEAGKFVPDMVSSYTPNGKTFDLALLRGKYVIIDFWGTWCGPCMAGMPKMKAYLRKYKDKLEIVGVATERDNGYEWKKTIKEAGLTWHHVLDRDDTNYVSHFAVAGYPTKIFVDPQGKIIGRYVGEGEDIYKKLDEILN